MGRPEKPLNLAADPITMFARDLRELRRRAGNPSYRDMSKVALFSPSVLSSAASGHQPPTLQVTLGFVDACGGDRAEWKARWGAAFLGGDRGERGRPAEPAEASGDRWPSSPELPGATDGFGLAGPSAVLPVPAQLPLCPRYFVGRRTELRQAWRAPAAPADVIEPLVVTGPVGVGKTAFALKVAHDLAARFPDGQLYADLEATDSHAVMLGFLRALGVPIRQATGGPGHLTGLYRSLLARRRILVVLDNVRDERQIRPLLTSTTCSMTLISSRNRLLGVDEVRRIALDVLPPPTALDLVAAWVGRERVEAERAACDRLVELCDLLPLALNIVARRLAAQPGRSIGALLDQLTTEGSLLGLLRIGDVSLRSRMARAYELLDNSARTALWHLASVDSPTGEKLAELLECGVGEAEDVLEELVDSGLVVDTAGVGQGYAVPGLCLAFVAEQSGAAGGRARPEAVLHMPEA
ncbi:NB-ARC domain-containing protein [Kitasatospora sp. NPDC059571]|uniref:NB-ARC domain-containing protein n=1 Tax=Kitasatospora sp. NPDC059571 TaxID=3346871 RepID=UPI0036BB362C